jgi:hypothetical protein
MIAGAEPTLLLSLGREKGVVGSHIGATGFMGFFSASFTSKPLTG